MVAAALRENIDELLCQVQDVIGWMLVGVIDQQQPRVHAPKPIVILHNPPIPIRAADLVRPYRRIIRIGKGQGSLSRRTRKRCGQRCC